MNSPSEISSLVTGHTSPRRVIATYNAYHLGDNLIHLHFLRKLALAHPEIAFTHTCDARHFGQLSPLLLGLPANNLQLGSAPAPRGAINAWRGTEGWFYRQPDAHDFLQIHLRWFRLLAEKMGLESPIRCARDMLFDYPALQKTSADAKKWDEFDFHFLVVNSPPRSGQWSGYNDEAFNALTSRLLDVGEVITTYPTTTSARDTLTHKMDVTAIGRLSQSVRCIIGCVTGPMWPTLNIWAKPETLRIHLLDSEKVELTPNTVHANSLTLIPEILREHGLL